MIDTLKLLHLADVHLDSAFSSLDAKKAEIRKNELRDAFSSALRFASEKQVDLVIISGDLFDSENVTRETAGFLKREFENVSPIRVFISPGNHDPYCENSVYATFDFPENVHIYRSDKLEKVELGDLNADIYGYAFRGRSLPVPPFEGKTPDDSSRINVLVAHADLFSASEVCPTTPAALGKSGFDYVALGHVHNGGDAENEGGTYFAYPGCLEGRDFGECGEKGGAYVEITKENGEFSLEYKKVRFSKRVYAKEKLDVTGAEGAREVAERVATLIDRKGYSSDVLLKVTLTGDVSPSFVLMDEYFVLAKEKVFSLEIEDKTRPLFDREELKNDLTLRGEFYSLLEDLLSSPDENERETAELALRYGLSALSGNNIVD